MSAHQVVDLTASAEHLSRLLADGPEGFVSARVPTTAYEVLARFVSLGFVPVGVGLTFEREPVEPTEAPSGGGALGLASANQRTKLFDIAACAFSYDRYHADPAISQSAADRIKRDWIESYLEGRRGDELLVFSLDESPVGFLAVLTRIEGGQRVGVIDVLGVHPEARRRGVGRALVHAFCGAAPGRWDCLRVGTQASNIPSIRLYEGMGFRLARAEQVLHRHSGPTS